MICLGFVNTYMLLVITISGWLILTDSNLRNTIIKYCKTKFLI